jgi:two-component system, NtrC family, response regulator AtoC
MLTAAPQILVVDDDAGQRSLLASCVQKVGLTVQCANNGQQALDILRQYTSIALVLSDINMPVMDGMALLKNMRSKGINIPVLLITGYADIRQAVEAMALGAVNYLEKPIDLDELRQYLLQTPGTSPLPINTQILLPGTVAESPQMKHIFDEVALVAPSTARVMITGESGSGKEIVADHLHAWSERSQQALIKINCAALPDNLLESELFGHEKGAFTGAVQRHEGCFERAHGGTLFLDEIGEMTPELQAKMLRVLQDGLVTRIGGRETLKVDVRVISATHRNLEDNMLQGTFREDLFYRLNVVELILAPLRERKADLVPLATQFAKKFSQKAVRFSPGFEKIIEHYPWPGNVRELQNAMERAVLLSRGGILMPEHLPKRIVDAQATPSIQREVVAESPEALNKNLATLEQEHILAQLAANNGNRSETARALGVSRRTLIYRIKDMEQRGILVPAAKHSL